MEYKISLITPVYNASKYLEDTFESVKNQTIGFDAIEYLMVDDGSTDDCGEMIARWAAQYPNVKHLTTAKNSGTPAAPRNLALDHATAPFVMFLDNDDKLFPNACKALYDEITATEADLVTGDARLMDEEKYTRDQKKVLLYSTDHHQAGRWKMSEGYGAWVEWYIANHWCKIYRREIIETNRIRCLEGELWEDILFLLLYMLNADDFVYIKEPIVQFRIRSEALSHQHNSDYYCSLPKSISFGLQRAIEMKKPELYVKLVGFGFSMIEGYIRELLDYEALSSEDLKSAFWLGKNRLSASRNTAETFIRRTAKSYAPTFRGIWMNWRVCILWH